MKKFTYILICLFATSGLFAQTKTETRPVSNFSAIKASSAFSITVNKGNTESLVIEADENIMPYVRSEVKNGELKLYLDGRKHFHNVKTMKAAIGVKNLNRVDLSGACKLSSNDLFDVPKFEIDLSGASNVQLNIKAQVLNVDASGASSIDLKAAAREAKFEASGSCKMQLDLQSAGASFDLSGACKAAITGATEHVTFDLSGACNIKAADFVAKTAAVDGSGVVKVEVYATDKLDVDCSGAGAVYYKGRPVMSVQTSGASKVKPVKPVKPLR